MAGLSVPQPTLDYQPMTPGLAPFDAKIEVRCGPAVFPDGASFGVGNLGTAGFFVYRQSAAGAPVEVFDEAAKQWAPDSGGAPLGQPRSFAPQQGGAWGMPLVPVGESSIFAAAAPGAIFPQYRFRAYFSAPASAGAPWGLSAPSDAVALVRFEDKIQAGLGMGAQQTPMNATRVRVFLRSGLAEVGHFEIRGNTTPPEVEVANLDAAGIVRARILLLPDGTIRLTPAAGRPVVVDGALEVQSLTVGGVGVP